MTEERTCPSGRCREGARVIAFVGQGERLTFVRPALPVDEAFVTAADASGDVGRRFRFAEPCQEAGCAQWTGSSCGVIERLLVAPDAGDLDPDLPRCDIRRSCRWFAQAGGAACGVCPYVLTDNRPALVPIAADFGR